MILHLFDDEKFTDMAVRIFEEVHPSANKYIVLSKTNELTYVKSTPCTVINIREINIKSFAHSLTKYDAILFHGLNNPKLKILHQIPEGIITVWIGLGHDYYDIIYKEKSDLFDINTKHLFKSNNNKTLLRMQLSLPLNILVKIKRTLLGPKHKLALINKFTFFAPVLKEEYTMVQDAMPDNFKPDFIDWNYGTLEDDLIREHKNLELTANNILVGNSAKYENNHLDSFEILKKYRLCDRKIITPLSYGDKRYRDRIVCEGTNFFGSNFMPLIDYMPIDEYIRLLSSCSAVIMHHIRQQALGNIITMMYLGAIVFLKKENPIYRFFKKHGAIVFTIDKLRDEPDLINYALSKNDIETNRKILRENWSRDVSIQKTINLINSLLINNSSF